MYYALMNTGIQAPNTPALTATGTCPVCHQPVAIVNHAVERGFEVGYLGRHGRPGIPATSKCRGSFGYWLERRG